MVFQVEHHLVHRDMSFEDHPARIVQDKTRDQAEHQVPIIGIFIVDLARVRSQQRLQGAEDLLNEVPTRPEPQQARRRDV
jgi:hypothetical protein